jgi:hypothetical protein
MITTAQRNESIESLVTIESLASIARVLKGCKIVQSGDSNIVTIFGDNTKTSNLMMQVQEHSQ